MTQAQLEAQLADAERDLSVLKFHLDNSSWQMGPDYRRRISEQRGRIYTIKKQLEEAA